MIPHEHRAADPVMASENPFGFMLESGMAPCCLDLADVLAAQGAAPIERLQNKACTPKQLQCNLSEPLAGWARGTEKRRLPA
jgi:hypothetical protein